MDIEILYNGTVCEGINKRFGFFSWPTIAKLNDGTLAVVCSGYRMHHICPFGKVVICYSKDEGKTWTYPAPIMDTPLDDRDSGICIFGDKVIVTSFNTDIDYDAKWIKVDEVSGWQFDWLKENLSLEHMDFIEEYLKLIPKEEEERYLGSSYLISEDGGYHFGKRHMIDITAPHGPIVLNNGELLYVGQDYWGNESSTSSNKAHGRNEIKAMKSCDGINWSEPVNIELPVKTDIKAFTEPHAAQLKTGRIVVQLRANSDAGMSIWQCYSDDNAKSFTKPYPLGINGGPPHLICDSDGDLISSYGDRRKPFSQKVMISGDGGESWESFTLRSDSPVIDMGYPATVELEKGKYMTVYYQRKEKDAPASILYTVWRKVDKRRD